MKSVAQTYYAKEKNSDELDRYRLLVESVQDYAIFLLDKDGNIATWNPGAEKFKGYKPHEIIGKHFSIFYSQKDRDNRKPQRELVDSKRDGRVEDEGWRIRKDGTRFWANVVITALYDKTGEHIGYAKVTRDLTERKNFEDELQRANVELKRSYRELQKLNQAKDEFVSLASHQLRTPATGVKQYLLLILDGYMGPISEMQQDCLIKAYESNERQINIVNDLLKVAQLDAGKVVINKEPTDLIAMVEDIIDDNVDMLKERKQDIKIAESTEAITAAVDKLRFRMVLDNLIDNASKYTPSRGKISITIAEKDQQASIAVEDTGYGIEPEELTKLFEKFTRGSGAATEDVTGSGLGLYWADKVVRLHGGTIEVSSTPNKGSTFTIIIPKE